MQSCAQGPTMTCLCAGHPAYDAFVHKFGRRHRSPEEYWGRQQVFQDNKQLIEQHNAGPSDHK